MSETTAAGTATPSITAPVVSEIYACEPCLGQEGNQPAVYEAVVEAGAGGPALLLWQATAWTTSPDVLAGMKPVINGLSDGAWVASMFFNQSAMRLPLVRRRALVPPLAPGEALVAVGASEYCCTDSTDSITMTLLNLGAMSAPPQVRLALFDFATGGGTYTSQPFSCDGGPLLVSIDASGWSGSINTPIGALLYLDGEVVGQVGLFANPAATHLPFAGADLVIQGVAPGGHQLDLMALSGTTVDDSDVFSLSVTEMVAPSFATALIDQPCPGQQGGGTLASAQYGAKGGEQLICVSLSGWSESDNQMLSAQVLVDGDPVGTLQTWASFAATHLPISGGDLAPGAMQPGVHQIDVVAGPGTVTDGNDRVALTVVELFR